MLEFDITTSTYELISKKLSTFEKDRSNVKDVRDDIIGNIAIRNTYIELGLLKKLEKDNGEEITSLKTLLSFSVVSSQDFPKQELIEPHDFKQWLNQVTDGIYDFSLCIDGLMTLCNNDMSNIDVLLNSPFLQLCGNFLKSSQNIKTNTKLLTFLSFLSFERDIVRKKVVDIGILEIVVKNFLRHKDNDLVLSSCLLLRSISRSVKLIRTAFDAYCFETLMIVFVEYSKVAASDRNVDIIRAISAIFCNFAMEHSPFRNVKLTS